MRELTMKTLLTILAAMMLAVSIMLLIQRHDEKHYRHACGTGATGPECQSTSMQCGLDTDGHIVPDGKGGCIPPPPSGGIASVEHISDLTPICDSAVGANKEGKCADNNGR
jgi:hypothetical protein